MQVPVALATPSVLPLARSAWVALVGTLLAVVQPLRAWHSESAPSRPASDSSRQSPAPHLADEVCLPALVVVEQPFTSQLAEAVRCFPLSPQQAEVALLLARGLTNADIAERMNVSLNTASYHVKQLFMKLDVHNRQEALRRLSEAQPACPEGGDRPARGAPNW